MTHGCPVCGFLLVWAAFRSLERRSVPWYRYTPPDYYCPKCRVRLHATVRPIGYVLITLMALASAAYVLVWFLHPAALVRAWYAPFGIIFVILPFGVCYVLWGRNLVRIGTEGGA